MSFSEEWVRLSDLGKVCPLCHHSDACCVSRDGSKILCTRVESSLKIGEPFAGGYIHVASNDYKNLKMPKKKRIKAPINWNTLNEFYQQKITDKQRQNLADEFNIHPAYLFRLEIGWDGEAYTFPMKKSNKEIIGIQRRFPNGKKCAVKGSSLGLFIPNIEISSPLFITEGVSDLAALLGLVGFYGIAKPSAQVGNDLVRQFILLYECNEIVIICDNDKAGFKGTVELVRKLTFCCNVVTIALSPPEGIKDLRKWIAKEGKDKVKGYLNAYSTK